MARELALPASVIGPSDVVRLRRNLEALDEQQHQSDLRATKGGPRENLQPGRTLREMADANNYNLSEAADRQALLEDLAAILKTAPTITMSFAVDPSSDLMTKLAAWFRTTINPLVLIRIGLQPSIAAGCIVRTPGKIYDFSLRSKFTEQRPMLVKRLDDMLRTSVTIKAPTVEAPSE